MRRFLNKRPPSASPPQEGCDQTPALSLLPQSRCWILGRGESIVRKEEPPPPHCGHFGGKGLEAHWEQEAGPSPGSSGQVRGSGQGPGCKGRAEQATSGSATLAQTQADRRVSGQLLSPLWESPSCPRLHPPSTIHAAMETPTQNLHDSHRTQVERTP